MEASLYIHVPFCAGACDYCDFYSIAVQPGDFRLERYTGTLLLEADRLLKKKVSELEKNLMPEKAVYNFPDGYKVQDSSELLPERELPAHEEDGLFTISTIYIGGGTPSLLGPAGVKKLLHGLLDIVARSSPSRPVEITLEANPESADEAFLAAAREGGVTRLSMGIQTFFGPSRRAVNRIGDDNGLARHLALASEYFPGAFSVDLMTSLPFQDERILLNDIAGVLLYKPAHVSLYSLTMRSKTPLPEAEQDEADRLWICGRDTLEKSGYSQYEVSNFCLEGKRSLHNIRYWRMYNWLALGPAASGTVINEERRRGFRYTIPGDVDAWLFTKGCGFSKKQKFPPEIEELDTLTLIKESILMGFRFIEGPDEELFRRRFRLGIIDLIPKTISLWRERGSLQKDKMALTKDGLLFLNRFLVDAFEELDVVFSSW